MEWIHVTQETTINDSETFLTLMPDTAEKVKKMIEEKKPEIKCWICGKKQDDPISAIESQRHTKDFVIFGRKIVEFQTKMTGFSLKRKKAADFSVPVCLICKFLILEIVETPQSLKESREEFNLSYI